MDNTFTKSNSLFCKIQALRKRMIQSGQKKGYTHPETLKVSQKLDKLIFKYQRDKQQ